MEGLDGGWGYCGGLGWGMRLLRGGLGLGVDGTKVLWLPAGMGEGLDAGLEMLLVVIKGLTLGVKG